MSAEELKLQRGLAFQVLQKTARKLEKAVNDNNERGIHKYLKTMIEDRDRVMDKMILYLTKAKKSWEDDDVKEFVDQVDTEFDDLKEQAEEIIENRTQRDNDETAEREKLRIKNVAVSEYQTAMSHVIEAIQNLSQILVAEDQEEDNAFIGPQFEEQRNNNDKIIQRFRNRVEPILSSGNAAEIHEAEQLHQKQYQEACNELQKNLHRKGIAVTTGPSHTACSVNGSEQSQGPGMRTKRLDFPKFNGNIRNYMCFKRDFNDMLEDNPYTDKQKSLILRQDCLQGEPKKLCENVKSYELLWQKLDEIYDDEPKVIQMVTDEIENHRVLAEKDYDGFIKFVDILEKAHLDLSSMGNDKVLDHPMTCRVVESKCPEWFQMGLAEKRDNSMDVDKLYFVYALLSI